MERENKFNKGDIVLITSSDSARGKTGVIDEVIRVGLCYDYKVIPSENLHTKRDSGYKVGYTVNEENLVMIDKSSPSSSKDPISIIECQNCGSINIAVFDTEKDLLKDHGVIYRRRKCLDCGHRFTTFEIHADDFRKIFPLNR